MIHTHHWRLAITPLSPVHMGAGQDYEPTAYVIDGGTLYEFDGIAALQVLPSAERERLGAVLAGRPSQDMLLQVQSFFHGNREPLMAVSRHQVRVNPTVGVFYEERVGRVAQHETGGGRVQNRLEIQRTAWNPPTGQAILPGSGLKGAIRTALLDAVNDGRRLPKDLERDRKANQRMQESLFKYKMGKLELDPMRLVRISDAALRNPDAFATEVRFAVNRKKQPVRDKNGTLVESQAEQHGLYQLLESLPPLQPRAFLGSLSVEDISGVQSEKLPSRPFRLPEIVAACNRFYRPILDRELALMRDRGYLDTDWERRLKTVLGGPVVAAMDQGRAFLLRAGRHSGAESVTLNGLPRSIRIMKGRGEKPEWLDHAKTLWLASEERMARTHLLPFGWLLVEVFQHDSELPAWPGDTEDAGIAAWREAVRRTQAALKHRLAEAQHEAAELKRAAEVAEREAAEREARLATLSPEARKLEALRKVFARDRAANRKQAGGELANALVALLKEAEQDWQGQECRELADLAVEIYGFIGWPASKKKRERQAQIEAIRAKGQ